MAVQNDNTILKKADLKAYHQQIAGQLGGTFALRTNNSDFFSTDEKVVGVYIDGKPLYQKTYQTTTGTNGQQKVVATLSNTIEVRDIIGTIAGITPVNFPGTTTDWRSSCYVSSSQLYISVNGYANMPADITLLYTKTTDQPNSAITSGAYDINFPNTWPANTEIFLGNGVYGYRATGTISGYNKEGRIDVQLGYSGRPQLVNTGGEVSINAGTDDNTIQWNGGYYWSNTDYITCSAVGISGGILRFQLTDPNSRPHRVDAWVVYKR